MKFEDEYLDVMQNLEASITDVYRERSHLLDKEVLAAVDALIIEYEAEQLNRPKRVTRLTENPNQVYMGLKHTCEWRLGRSEFRLSGSDESIAAQDSLDVREILGCLKRIKKSVRFWSKQGGKQGYLRYVSEFV